MAATTMLSISSLVSQLARDYPALTFTPGERFYWNPEHRTIYYVAQSNDAASLLHEVAHGILVHRDFIRDIELLEMERDAWDYASATLAPRYGITIDADAIQTNLDTYRDWLHMRSICPACHATGVQIKQRIYRCLACRSEWTVNDARQHALRRHITKKHSR